MYIAEDAVPQGIVLGPTLFIGRINAVENWHS